eukprot:TRINITY_DN59_c0_g1_i2.p1 TRINITY_DN59_c0_g1~~TRINITY_DN59_c0_g1_i2.p1  ORF type:complete len:579 (+),score=243.39 TRINITY_DN59_c0_g1_i2:107-1738(+)
MRAVALLLGAAAASGAGLPQAQTAHGVVQGTLSEDGSAYLFRGVPYAAPPVGDLRLTPPRPPARWEGVRKADAFAPGCPQACDMEVPEISCPATTSEDCLYLNVYGPARAAGNATAKLPVMFFIHGGNFDQGSGGVPFYEGYKWASEADAILVTVSYRLGVLGALYLPDAGINGSFNLQDQRLALTWVRDNIAAFGGDAGNVLLFGQSAGGSSVASHLASPKSKGLFHSAIVMSNPYGLPVMDTKTQRDYSAKLLQQMNCSTSGAAAAQCIRALSPDAIIAVQKKTHPQIGPIGNLFEDLFMPFTPTVGTEELPVQPIDAALHGMAAGVPTVFSTVSEEAIQFIYAAFTAPITGLEAEAVVGVLFGVHAGKVLKMYPKPSGWDAQDGRMWLSRLATDYIFTCATRRAAEVYSKSYPTWRFEYTHHNSFTQTMFNTTNPIPSCIGYVCHGSDLPLYFGTWDQLPDKVVPTDAEVQLSRQIQQAISNLLRHKDPAAAKLPGSDVEPPRFQSAAPDALQEETPLALANGYRATYCATFDSLGYSRR